MPKSGATLWGLDEKATRVIEEGTEVAVAKVHGWGSKLGVYSMLRGGGGMGASIHVCGGAIS